MMDVVRAVPDVSAILHLGDFVGDDPSAIDWAAPLLADIDMPGYAVLGNHDHWSDPERVSGRLADAGITMLTNRSLELGGIVLAGVDSCWGGSPDIRASLKGVDEAAPVIVLGHEPWLATLHDRWLHVAGHTHHGQVRAPLFGDRVMNRSMPKKSQPYPRGRYQRTPASAETPATWAYTTAGVGYSTADFRFLCPPEIVVLDLS
jgi:predicted MPP superfamily phosphohydrolase